MNNTPYAFDFAFATRLMAGNSHFELDVHCQSRAQRLAIIGPSGSGKSLILQMLAGLLRPQSGHVRINGHNLGDTASGQWPPPQQRQAGLMFQDYALFPHLTVAQNIAFGLNPGLQNPPHTADALTRQWLERMQLQAVAAHYPAQISGGQRQRTALARACITRPQWLLLDEPFSALDSGLRTQMRQLVAELQAELAVPMLLISHDSADTEMLADAVADIRQGRLQYCD